MGVGRAQGCVATATGVDEQASKGARRSERAGRVGERWARLHGRRWQRSAASACQSAPEQVPGGYVILSHVWLRDGQEDTFQTVGVYSDRPNEARNIGDHILGIGDLTTGPDPSSPPDSWNLISPKIQGFLKIAKSYGYGWAWADTCCIDKTSSSDLSEAINSMFIYYALADICIVYLADVSSICKPRYRQKCEQGIHCFCNSQWHDRGWTLQELLAPDNVYFFSQEWTPLGNKHELASLLHRVTRIPEVILRQETDRIL